MNRDAMADFIHAAEPSIAEQLGTDLDDARSFALVALYAISRRPELYRASRESLLAALLTCARLKLVPGLGLGYLSVERDDGDVEAIFVPTYIGFIDLLERCAGLRDIRARLVFTEDRFRLHYGAHERLEHRPTKKLDRGTLLGAYVVCKLEDGSERFEHLCRGDIEPVRPDGDSPPDSARGMSSRDYGEWLKGCAVKRLAKWFTRTPEIAAAVELERTSEKCKVRPRAVDVARMLGIDIASRNAPDDEPDFLDEIIAERTKANPEFPALVEKALVERRAKEVDEEQQETTDDRCCACGNLESLVGSLMRYVVHPRAWRKCLGCGGLGVEHDLCPSCLNGHAKARKQIDEAESKRDAQRTAIANSSHKAAEKRRKKIAAEPNGPDSSSALAPESKVSAAGTQRDDSLPAAASPHVDPTPTPAYGSPIIEEAHAWDPK